ncbi:hypothetical protein, conserved [Trypanosoma brucei gambiense DAL972]|uniref:Uncharacterized protein n=1 Tax=Trypanosoma brucei gambiense (strain MHOM/CI/86/DAL972) TaxID=679716 RepID=C9ZV82_TRYB9|nr:hypothetical protein, conserved [Trypanosoma brucei gambiense DAL972]CBH13320.1 hypothetical protein, conserved [Trypanosoma brucei gambiense DAL972]|eukprot:XP_011775597.1 hypothetical protein, conserved [Trypanosoma brucei gambiense DAL972]
MCAMEYSDYTVGLSHLWHMHHLAAVRLQSGKGITGLPYIDFRNPETMDHPQLATDAIVRRLHRRIAADEQHIVKANCHLRDVICNAGDPAYRRRRNMNNLPTEEEVATCLNSAKHTAALERARLNRVKNIQRENYILLEHLKNTKCSVTSAKELNRWYNNEYKKRSRMTRHFKPREPFCGARVLTAECKFTPGTNPDYVTSQALVETPSLWMHRREPTVVEVLAKGPVLPSLQEAANQYIEGCCYTDTKTGVPHLLSRSKGGKRGKAEWKGISKLDVKLMNYANDLKLVRGGNLPIVRRGEENGITSLWRGELEKRSPTRCQGPPWRWLGATEKSNEEKAGGQHQSVNTIVPGRWDPHRSIMGRVRKLALLKDKRHQYAKDAKDGNTRRENRRPPYGVPVIPPAAAGGFPFNGSTDAQIPYGTQRLQNRLSTEVPYAQNGHYGEGMPGPVAFPSNAYGESTKTVDSSGPHGFHDFSQLKNYRLGSQGTPASSISRNFGDADAEAPQYVSG